jgi:hypothetical protein
MSCPNLELHIASTATLSDIAEFIGVDLLTPSLGSDQQSIQVGAIGHIDIRQYFQYPLQYGKYHAKWSLVVSFGGPYSWYEIRFQMLLQLCAHLAELHDGTYLARYDTGSIAFYFRDGMLVLPESEKSYLSRFPIPFSMHAFENLPPI